MSRQMFVDILSLTADAQSGTSANGDSGADADALHISTMAQFARDAFPGLEAKRRWFVRIMTSLAGALLILLLLTCAVSWNLAIGQRLLTDYRWLSLHPAVLQTDPAPAPGTPCAAPQTSQQRPAVDNAPASAPKDGGETDLIARLILSPRLCARCQGCVPGLRPSRA
jgi:hypothetical protein